MIIPKTISKILLITVIFSILILAGCSGGITGQAAADLGCSIDVKLKVLELEDYATICKTDTTIEITVENLGESLSGLYFNIDSSLEDFDYEIERDIVKAATARVIIPYNPKVNGDIIAMEIVPVFGKDAEKTLCMQKSIPIDEIEICS